MATQPDKALTKKAGAAQYEMVTGGADVLIGGENPLLWVPEFHAEKWKGHAGHCYVKFKHADAAKVKASDKVKEEKKDGKTKLSLKIDKKTHIIEEGSVKWSVQYDKAADLPADYEEWVVEWPANQMEWYYQGALTAEEIANGDERPDNVVGSYALYVPQSGRYLDRDGNELVNYETGKFGHVYRPEWVDAAGRRAWGTMELVGDRLRCYRPDAAWLAAATYPVTLDPAFGVTSVGGSTSSLTQNRAHCMINAAPDSSGTLDSLSFYSKSTSTSGARGAVYTETSDVPDVLVGVSDANTSRSVDTWVTMAFPTTPAVTGSLDYWLAMNAAAFAGCRVANDGSSNKTAHYVASTYPNFPDPFTGYTTSSNSALFSVYATYTEGASGPSKAVFAALRSGSLLGGR